jgi:hypothetical protein
MARRFTPDSYIDIKDVKTIPRTKVVPTSLYTDRVTKQRIRDAARRAGMNDSEWIHSIVKAALETE